MTRVEYIRTQRAAGRAAVAVLPVHYPKELLTAADVLAVELWGPPGPPRGDQAGRLQTYVCPIGRNALAFLASGAAGVVDAVVFPHTCDTVQGLATLLPDFGGWSGKALVFQHPKGPPRPSARAFLFAELRAFAASLQSLVGRAVTDARLRWALELHREIDHARAALLGAGPRLALADGELYRILRRGEWLWPEDHLAELRDAQRAIRDGPARTGVPVLVTGYVPEPPQLLDVLGGAGAYVAGDDYAAVGRRVNTARPPVGSDPWAALVEQHWSAPPCPTRSADVRARVAYLLALARRHGARGAILHLMKFCEPELFDVPAIRAAFAAAGLPVLTVESELERELPGQAVTRVEAFVEMLAAGRAA